MEKISNLKINKLFGFQNLDIPIKDNKIILVGVNGLGKSTVLTILYYFLSRQWHKLTSMEFESLELVINNKTFLLTQDELRIDISSSRMYHFLPPRIRRALKSKQDTPLVHEFLTNKEIDPESIPLLSRVLDMPERYVSRLHEDIFKSINQTELDIFEDSGSNVAKRKENFSSVMDKTAEKILFLPTYRRIEKDLSDLFPLMSNRRRNEMNDAIQEAKQKRQSSSIELIEFGMEDVQRRIDDILLELKDTAHTTFKQLAGSNFKEIVYVSEGKDYSNDVEKIQKFSDEDISRILNRVEDKSLTESEKSSIVKSIDKIKDSKSKEDNKIQQLIAHFFIQLSEIDLQLSEKERVITKFTNSCNLYLGDSGKHLIYDSQNYRLTINWDNKKPVEFKALSSGEKQIVSIFSDLYLSNYKSFALIIDEPELSLSIGWQKKFLPEIIATGRCSFIASATHSPFIFENELNEYAQDIREFCSEC